MIIDSPGRACDPAILRIERVLNLSLEKRSNNPAGVGLFFWDFPRVSPWAINKKSTLDLVKGAVPCIVHNFSVTKSYAQCTHDPFPYKKNPVRYKLYKYFCGREKRLDELWGE